MPKMPKMGWPKSWVKVSFPCQTCWRDWQVLPKSMSKEGLSCFSPRFWRLKNVNFGLSAFSCVLNDFRWSPLSPRMKSLISTDEVQNCSRLPAISNIFSLEIELSLRDSFQSTKVSQMLEPELELSERESGGDIAGFAEWKFPFRARPAKWTDWQDFPKSMMNELVTFCSVTMECPSCLIAPGQL